MSHSLDDYTALVDAPEGCSPPDCAPAICSDLSGEGLPHVSEEPHRFPEAQELFSDGKPLHADDDVPPPSKKQDDGFLRYKKWWFRREVDISVNGERITGTPIFLDEDALRVVSGRYSYFIPMCKVDYIRTNDGLECM